MSTDDYSVAFGDEAASAFKERLKELMRAQQEAFEEVQAERPMPLIEAPASTNQQVITQQAVALATAGMASLGPQPSPQAAAEAMEFLYARAIRTVMASMQPPG